MKIADGLMLQKDIAEEVSRLRSLAKESSWEYRKVEVDAKWQPTFDLEANIERVRKLLKLQRAISRAISRTNNQSDLIGLNDEDYKEWL
jgi:hypothetical protein